MQAWIPVVSSSLYFWKSVFSFRADSILKSDGDFISNWKFPDCVHFFGAWNRQAVIETIAVVYDSRKELRRNCSPIGHHNTKHFLSPIRSRHPLEFLEIAQWESVPRGSFTRTWKHSSRPFSRPDWLPLGLRGWTTSSSTYHTDKRLEEHINVWNPLGRHVVVWCSLALILQGIRVSHLHKFAHRLKSISKLHLLYKYWKLH